MHGTYLVITIPQETITVIVNVACILFLAWAAVKRSR